VNSPECHALLRELAPAVVAVYGTRILKRTTLEAVSAPFINYHAGINPKYRGQHPGYWALASGDAENAGITIHLVDEGVDTGAVLYQTRVTFAPEDTIASYQHLQAAHALPLFVRAIQDALAARLSPRHVELPSRQYFPPTIWGYLATGLTRGVW
jgi:methionyl-tRNA formyltransferase